jgi:hypothetical protein
MHFTKHAQNRMQQRGIMNPIIDLLYSYGREIRRSKAGDLIYFDKRAREQLRKDLPRHEYVRIQPKLKAYVVEGEDGSIVTVGYRFRSIHT